MLKSMGEAHFRTSTPPKPLNQFRCHVKYITTSPQGVDEQNLVGIDSAVTDLRMREKNTVCEDFFIDISFCLSVSSSGLQVTVLGRFSHARTAERECCKGDDESQWERGKFDPPPPKNPLTDGHQHLRT